MSYQHVISEGRVPIKVWTSPENIEDTARQQLINLSNMKCVVGHISSMPDVHAGIGVPIGTVFATQDAIIPSAVGGDIGCGMAAVQTSLKVDEVSKYTDALCSDIEKAIPTGFNSRDLQRDTYRGAIIARLTQTCTLTDFSEELTTKAKKFDILGSLLTSQLGTLGGGNHFIELSVDQDDNVWIVLHSGSRGMGQLVARHYVAAARMVMTKMFIDLPDPQLAFIPSRSELFSAYLNDMQCALRYAEANRLMMLEIIKSFFFYVDGNVIFSGVTECHHNFIAKELHNGKLLYITRKGAVRARSNDRVIIPGSMGTETFIACGRNDVNSYTSCAHGAGRVMSRNKAIKTFTVEDLISQTEGVMCCKDDGVLDEVPAAYKNIHTVMEDQKDLITPLFRLKQFMCIKGQRQQQ